MTYLDTLVIAFFGFLTALAAAGSPLFLSYLTNRYRREEKLEDYARLDMVAKKADEAAARNASLIAESSNAEAKQSAITIGKLDVIHTLVNSTLTASMQVSLDGVRRELLLLQNNVHPSPDLIETTKKKIADLEKIIEERNKQTHLADLENQQVDAAKASAVIGVAPKAPEYVPLGLGPVTKRVLEGKPVPSPIKKQEEAAEATVEAAEETVKAASDTVDALKAVQAEK